MFIYRYTNSYNILYMVIEMVTRKTWKEFQDTKLLWWINRILHTFGWAIILEMDGCDIVNVYPARVKFRGFDKNSEEKGFIGITQYLTDNVEELNEEVN